MTLTSRQTEVLDFIKSHLRDEGYSPTQREIAEAMEVSQASVVGHLTALESKGAIRLLERVHRGIRVIG